MHDFNYGHPRFQIKVVIHIYVYIILSYMIFRCTLSWKIDAPHTQTILLESIQRNTNSSEKDNHKQITIKTRLIECCVHNPLHNQLHHNVTFTHHTCIIIRLFIIIIPNILLSIGRFTHSDKTLSIDYYYDYC